MYGAVQHNTPVRFGQYVRIQNLDDLVDAIKEAQVLRGDSCRSFEFTLGDGQIVKKRIGFDVYSNMFDVTHSNHVMEYMTANELMKANIGFVMQNTGLFTKPL